MMECITATHLTVGFAIVALITIVFFLGWAIGQSEENIKSK